MWIFLMVVSNAVVFGYLLFGMRAVGYVAQVALAVAVVWVGYRLFIEFWDELSYRYHRDKVLREWAQNKHRLS